MRTRFLTYAALAMLAVSCATVPPPVPVSGSPDDLSLFAGEWSGGYHSVATGRSGIITFSLSAGADTAFGEVVMFPPDRRGDATPSQTQVRGQPAVPRVLSIRFVRAAEGTVSGRLDPYRDPDCDCMVTTVFEGRVKDDVIEGEYVSHRTGSSDPVKGEWSVRRKKP